MVRNLKRSTRPVLHAFVGLSAAAVLAACGNGAAAEQSSELVDSTGPTGDDEWQSLIEEAKEEGQVSIYSVHAETTLIALAERFEDEYGIKVNVSRYPDADLQPKLEAEMDSNKVQADVVGLTADTFFKAKQPDGWWTAPTGPAFTEEGGVDREIVMVDDEIFRSMATVMSFGWNTDRLPDGIESFEDILDPSLGDGKIGVTYPVAPSVWDYYTYLQQEYGDDVVDRLAAQKPRVYSSGAAAAEALASGEIAVALQVESQGPAKEAGAPTDSFFPEPSWGTPVYVALMANAPHPSAAQLLANYMMTPAGQEAIAGNRASVIADVPGTVTTLDKTTSGTADVTDAEGWADFREMFDRNFG